MFNIHYVISVTEKLERKDKKSLSKIICTFAVLN